MEDSSQAHRARRLPIRTTRATPAMHVIDSTNRAGSRPYPYPLPRE